MTDAIPFTSTANVLVVRATVGSTVTDPWEVGLYYREAEVGDFVYADGSWSDKYNLMKTIVGVCFYVNGNDRMMVGLKNIANDSLQCWGLTSDRFNGLSVSGGYAAFDIPSSDNDGMPNISASGISGTIGSVSNGVNNYVDENGNFRTFASGAIANLGLKEVTNVALGLISRTDFLVESDVVEGSSIPIGRYRTLFIIKHRNRILSDANFDYPIPSNENDDELNELNSLIAQLVASNNNQAKYSAFYYPMASKCYAYSPLDHIELKPGEVLSDKFKRHKWFMPAAGELARLYGIIRKVILMGLMVLFLQKHIIH